MKTGTILDWIRLSLNVCVRVCVCVHKDQILWRKRAREGRSEGGLWPQCFFASVFNFRGLLSDFQCLDIAHLTFSPLCLEYFHIHVSQLSKQLSAIVFDLPMGSAVFSTCYAGHHLCLCHLSLPQIGQAPKMHEDFCPLTLTAFSKTRASRGRSPLGPSIQTGLLCWGVISTGSPSPSLLPSFLGPPNGRRLMSTRNFVPHFPQPPPDPPCSWKTLALAQRAPVRP